MNPRNFSAAGRDAALRLVIAPILLGFPIALLISLALEKREGPLFKRYHSDRPFVGFCRQINLTGPK